MSIFDNADASQSLTRKEIELEAEMLLGLDHDNIIKMYEYRDIGLNELSGGVTVPKIYYVLEYAEVGTLLDLIMNTK